MGVCLACTEYIQLPVVASAVAVCDATGLPGLKFFVTPWDQTHSLASFLRDQ